MLDPSRRSPPCDHTRFAQARANLPGSTITPFAAPGIPRAVGYDTLTPGALTHTVTFTAGPYYSSVPGSSPHGDRGVPTREQIISATTGLYERVHRTW